MIKKRFLSMLALLCLTVSGAWAQEVTLLTTIENTGDNIDFTSGSKTFDNIATVTFSGTVYNDGDYWGWYSEVERTLTVTAAEGYTITRVKFYTDEGSAFDEEAPFEAISLCDDEGGYVTKVNGTSIGEIGVTKIEVYGYENAPATVDVTGVTLSQTSATLTAGGAALELTPTVAPEGATDKTVKWSVEQTGDFVALYTDEACTQAVGTDAIAAAKVYVKPLAAGQATVTVTTNDGAKTATCAVTVAAPAAPTTYTVTLKEGTEDATNWTITPAEATTTGVAAGTTVTATYSGTKKVKSVKAVKKASAVIVTAITLNKTATTISAGQTETLSVSSVTPDDATDQTVTWSSDNEAVATVDADGKVTAVAFGTANITATANDGSGVTATCAVTVSKVVTINQSDWGDARSSFTKDGVTVSGDIDPYDGNLPDGGTFSTTLGNFTKIEVTAEDVFVSGTGWSGSTWTGNASSVSFSGSIYGYGEGTTKFVFTIEPTN